MDAQIVSQDVVFSYDGERDVLRGVSLAIPKGAYVAVVGRNGSGKSTLARCINALLVPDEGQVSVCGISSETPQGQAAIRRRVGMVFQNPDNQMVTSIVADDVAFGPENLGVPQPQIVERARRALEAVSMDGHAGDDISELSGGQKQLVAIAGMLAMEPEVLVLDEPCAMLDPQGRARVLGAARELNRSGMTVVNITHFMDDALEADLVYVMDDGAVVAHGTPDEVFSQGEHLLDLGLEPTFAYRLSHALRRRGVDVPLCVRTPQLFDRLAALGLETAATGEGAPSCR